MTFKSFTDNAKSFTFKHEFETMDHANVTSTAILGYMVGTYEQQPTEITIGGNEANNTFTMVVEYVEDKDLQRCLTVFVIALRAILRVAVKHS